MFLGVPWRAGLEQQLNGSNWRFLVISVAISSEPLELKAILLCGVMKCLIGFSVTLKCLTLKSHFTLKSVFIIGLTRFFCRAFEDIYVKTNQDTPILSATKMFARDSSFCLYEVYSDMCCKEASIDSGCYSCRLAMLLLSYSFAKNPTCNI